VAKALKQRCAAAGLNAFLDTDELRVGAAWREDVERALDYSATLLVCFGASGSSPYRDELLKRARQRSSVRIVPVFAARR
jgi:hypothetical protein